jgi:hypothetical protein
VQCENISPTLRADARILSEVYQNIFHHAPDMSQQYSRSRNRLDNCTLHHSFLAPPPRP